MTEVALAGVGYVYANWGRWVADCPVPFCTSALKVEHGQTSARCLDCGNGYDLAWPADAETIEELLRARPDPTTRNWVPGESVTWLLTENLAHGIDHASAPELGAAASRLVLDADTGGLRLLDEPLIIDAAPRLAIGD